MITVEEGELVPYLDRAASQLSRQVKIEGFRPGKVPKAILEQYVPQESIRAYALELALPQFYATAVIENKVQAIAKPQIKVITEQPFVFEAIVPILPEVNISGHEKIKISSQAIEIKPEEVQEMIQYFQKQSAEYSEVDRPVQMGDRVEIDFDGFDPEGNVPLENTSSKNHPFVLGEGGFIPGFEDKLVGMKVGEETSFELTFPTDYRVKKFADKKVKFVVKMNKVSEVRLPEITPEWIKGILGEEKSIDEFKAQIQENLLNQRKSQEEQRREAELFEELIKHATIEIPPVLIEEEIDFILEKTRKNMESRGLKWDQYLEYLKTQNRDLRVENREKAEKQVKLRLVLQHLIKSEGIEVTDQAIQQALEEMVKDYPEAEKAKVMDYYEKNDEGQAQIKNKLLFDQLLNRFLSR